MSDYLWDKTGEPDAETERLEELLGQLRFQPTPFDLPAGLPAKNSRAARTRNVLSWPRLAVAASVTLAVLLGAWVMLRQQSGTVNDKQHIASQNKQTGAGQNQSGAPAPQASEIAGSNEVAGGNRAGAEKKADDAQAVAPSKGSETPREKLSGGYTRPKLPDIDTPRRTHRAAAARDNRNELARAPRREKRLPLPPRVEPALREETAAAEREAAEKVLYALRVTSEKLNYARQQVRESARGEDNR